LRVRPQDGPGWEHLLFSLVANVLISICAFLSVVLFFKSRTVFQERAGVFHRTQESTANGAASPRREGNRPQRSLRTHDRNRREAQPAVTFAQRHSAVGRRAERRAGAGVPPDLPLAGGRGQR